MAKGDSQRARTAINDQRSLQLGQQSNLGNQFQQQYNTANNADTNTRSQIEQRYQEFNPDYSSLFAAGGAASGGGGGVSGGIDPSKIENFGADPYAGYKQMSQGLRPEFWNDFNKYMGGLDTAMQGYTNFANTGGFSGEDLSNIRARSMAPTRAVYQNMENELQRQSSLGNITSPLARLRGAREANTAISDTAQGTEANIAGLTQQGKEFGVQGQANVANAQVQARNAVEQLDQQMRAAGLGGMTDIEKTKLSAELQNAQLNQSASGANASLAAQKAALQLNAAETANAQKLQALQGWTGLYGTTPAATALAGNQQLQLQNMAQSGNLGLIGQQIQASQIPSDFSQALGNIGGTLGLVGQVGGMIAGGGIPGIGGLAGSKLPNDVPGINIGSYSGVPGLSGQSEYDYRREY